MKKRGIMGTVKMDDKYRVLLTKDVREKSGIGKENELVAIPFKGGVTLLSPDESYRGSLTGFDFREKKHEASRFLFDEG
ncbi:hypothetical protein AKJ39_03920 [candidate division MSBL1 archaeon SCGC-AAA259J03]|uniref:SpoVT-AbrB domain-containing protein n=1 Tax=candidate division MSBL1 archaeon SCGC-AAA259J03 TaxID=1698269 RepID=A0A656YVD0_9EURY|nr:hypothetical protein AKJ39_03920 [candidate division MSBL1 archaeon SCGC-AAA259J03]